MKIKMTGEHFDALAAPIYKLMETNELETWLKQGLTAKRYRWDLLYACGDIQVPGRGIHTPLSFICKVLYQYLNDSNIDTALRLITRTPK